MNISSYFDHTMLKPDMLATDVHRICAEAMEHRFAAVCIPPFYVTEASKKLDGRRVKLATVIGFPMGYSATFAKVEEIKRAIAEGAQELDAVANIAAIKNKNWNFVQDDMDRMITACRLKGKVIKIIIETGLLTNEEIKKVCQICNIIKPNFVKTSTGLLAEGATPAVIKQLRTLLDKDIKIKASGGIRTLEAAQKLIDAGADRLGSSSSVDLVKG